MADKIESSEYHEKQLSKLNRFLDTDPPAAFKSATWQLKNGQLPWNYRMIYLIMCAMADVQVEPENWERVLRHWAEAEAAYQIAMRCCEGHIDFEKISLLGSARCDINFMKAYLDACCPLQRRERRALDFGWYMRASDYDDETERESSSDSSDDDGDDEEDRGNDGRVEAGGGGVHQANLAEIREHERARTHKQAKIDLRAKFGATKMKYYHDIDEDDSDIKLESETQSGPSPAPDQNRDTIDERATITVSNAPSANNVKNPSHAIESANASGDSPSHARTQSGDIIDPHIVTTAFDSQHVTDVHTHSHTLESMDEDQHGPSPLRRPRVAIRAMIPAGDDPNREHSHDIECVTEDQDEDEAGASSIGRPRVNVRAMIAAGHDPNQVDVHDAECVAADQNTSEGGASPAKKQKIGDDVFPFYPL